MPVILAHLPLTAVFTDNSLNLSRFLLPDSSIKSGARQDQRTPSGMQHLPGLSFCFIPYLKLTDIFVCAPAHWKISWHIVVKLLLSLTPKTTPDDFWGAMIRNVSWVLCRSVNNRDFLPWILSESRGMGFLISKKFPQTHSHKVSGSSWVPEALRLGNHAQEK